MSSDLRYLLLIVVVFGIGAIVFQSVLVPFIEIDVWKPDMVLVVVLLIGKRFGSMSGSSAGFVLGLLQDALSAQALGITALPKALAGYGAGKINPLRLEGTAHYLWFLLFVFLHELIFYFILQFKLELTFTYLIYSRVFPNTVYTFIMLFVTQLFTQKIFSEQP